MLHARVFCHATESLEKVKLALANIVGPAFVEATKAEGHHGNPITILEARLEDREDISAFFRRLKTDNLEEIKRTLSARMDDSCNLFIRFDKQAALKGNLQMGVGADIVSVRLRVRAFPSRLDAAIAVVDAFLADEIARRSSQAHAT